MKKTNTTFLSSPKGKIIMVILSVVFSSLIFAGWRYINQQKLDKVANNIFSQVESKSNQLLEIKDQDSKSEAMIVQDLLLELDRVEYLLMNDSKANNPDLVAAVNLIRKIKNSVYMIETGIMENDNDLKSKGYKLFESLMFEKE